MKIKVPVTITKIKEIDLDITQIAKDIVSSSDFRQFIEQELDENPELNDYLPEEAEFSGYSDYEEGWENLVLEITNYIKNKVNDK